MLSFAAWGKTSIICTSLVKTTITPLERFHFSFQKQPDDEDFLVDNEEELDLKEEPDKAHVSKEYLGKLQYKVTPSGQLIEHL